VARARFGEPAYVSVARVITWRRPHRDSLAQPPAHRGARKRLIKEVGSKKQVNATAEPAASST